MQEGKASLLIEHPGQVTRPDLLIDKGVHARLTHAQLRRQAIQQIGVDPRHATRSNPRSSYLRFRNL